VGDDPVQSSANDWIRWKEENAMIRITPRVGTRATVTTALAVGALLLGVVQASAASARVTAACASDYLAYCSQHDPDGPGVRRCMRANGLKLSMGCVNALIAAGEVSKDEVARRARSAR
jgi:hypothetical protein